MYLKSIFDESTGTAESENKRSELNYADITIQVFYQRLFSVADACQSICFAHFLTALVFGPIPCGHSVPSVTRCRCCRCRCCCGHRCAGGVQQWRRATVATPGEWQCKTGGVRRLAVANGPNIFQMLLVIYRYFTR